MKLRYTKPVEKKKFVYCVSLFRPKIRNDKFRLYYDSLEILLRDFEKIFPFSDCKLRIYYDGSLFSTDYTGGDVNEAHDWLRMFRRLSEIKFVEHVKCAFEDFMEDDAHHRGLFGTLFRFYALADAEQDVVYLSRDLDGNVIAPDKHSIVHWTEQYPKSRFHAYVSTDYKSYTNNKHFEHMVGNKEFEFYIPAGMCAFKNVTPVALVDLIAEKNFRNPVMYKERLDGLVREFASTLKPGFVYGFDELFLNTVLLPKLGKNTFVSQEAYDFYNEPERQGIHSKKRNLYAGLFMGFEDAEQDVWTGFVQNVCSSAMRLPLDVPKKEDLVGEVGIHAGYINSIVYEFIQYVMSLNGNLNEAVAMLQQKIRNYFGQKFPLNTIMLWDHLLGDTVPIKRFKRVNFTTSGLDPMTNVRLRGRTLHDAINKHIKTQTHIDTTFKNKVVESIRIPFGDQYVPYSNAVFAAIPQNKVLDVHETLEKLEELEKSEKRQRVNGLCIQCELRPAELLCGGCQSRSYCSRECGLKDWKEHRVACVTKV